MAEGALSDLVVLELASGVAGPYCGKLLADLGAQVIKVERAHGDPLRREPPLVAGESVYFNFMNGNKLGVMLEDDDERLAALLARADIVVHDRLGPSADALEAVAAAANRASVILSVTPYGRTGPRAAWKTSELTEWATGGYHYFAGDPAREPLALPGFQAEYHAGLHAAFAALAGAWHARDTGEGQRIELSHQEATLSDHAWLSTMWTHTGQVQRRTGSLYARCADGFIFLFNLVPYPNLLVLMDRMDLLADESLQDPQTWAARFDEVFQAFSEWAATRTRQEIFHAAQELRIAASPVNTMQDVANSEQLAARDWYETVRAGGTEFKAPGFPYKLMGTPCTNRLPAPAPGQHTGEVLSGHFHWANEGAARPARRSRPSSRGGPLAGLRVVEVTANWAGPAGGRQFADLGAEVIKIELARKPATRALVYAGGDVWPEFYNRAGYFNKLNRNKKAIALDLSHPKGRDVFLELVRKADAVLENNAARVMAQLQLAYEDLAAVNPGIVMCSMSGFGNTGPQRNYSAYGSNIETLSGLASLLAYGDGQYFGTGSFYADPVTGNHGAVAMLAALHARRRTGRGQWIDMALLEAVGPFFARPFLEYTVTGVLPRPDANRHPRDVPQDVYRTAGADCWVALSVRDEHEWAGLAKAIGRPDFASDPRLRSPRARRDACAAIDAAIREWCASRDHNEAAEILQAHGVPAAPVMANWEIVSDNHLNDRGFFIPVRHATAGTFLFPGFPWKFERTPASLRCAAPMFAEHNHDVFEGLLQMSPGAVAGLYELGVTSDHPEYAGGPSL